MQATCGNCGKPVEGSDITCPYCGVVLAAYASPIGAIPPPTDERPAPEIDILGEDYALSSPPRPLFATHVTVGEQKEALHSENDETLLAVEAHVAYEPAPWTGETIYADNRPASDTLSFRSGFWKESSASNYDGTERSDVEAYRRKLLAATESESEENGRTKSINAYNPVPRERSIIEWIFSWSEKEDSEIVVGRTLLVKVPGAMVLQATGLVDFPLANLIIVLVLVGSFVIGLLKNSDS